MKKHSRGPVWVTGLKLKSHPVTKCSSGPQPYSHFSLREMTSFHKGQTKCFMSIQDKHSKEGQMSGSLMLFEAGIVCICFTD